MGKVLVLVLICWALPAKSQTAVRVEGDTTFFDLYTGVYQGGILQQRDGVVKHGDFSFQSQPQQVFQDSVIALKDFRVDGPFKNGLRQGSWRYQFRSGKLSDLQFKQARNVDVGYRLDGTEDVYEISYKDNRMTGSWRHKHRVIANGKYGTESTVGDATFENDTLKGKFSFANTQDPGKAMAAGSTNTRGFLDGEMVIEYVDADLPIIEKRTYRDGFLIGLEKRNRLNDSLVLEVTYDDVVGSLIKLEDQEGDLSYAASNEWFGIWFDNGYPIHDIRRRAQECGNRIIAKNLALMDSIGDDRIAETGPVFKLTRRFRFVYAADEGPVWEKLKAMTDTFSHELTGVLKQPNLMLRKESTDSLFANYQWLLHTQDKLEAVQDVIEKAQGGYFNYIDRASYYRDGIEQLNRVDTIIYNFRNDTIAIPYSFSRPITSADSIAHRLLAFVDEQYAVFAERHQEISHSLNLAEKQSVLDSLDKRIAELELWLAEQYPDETIYAGDIDIDEVPFSYKLHRSFQERLITPMKQQYIDNGRSFDEMSILGEELICLLSFLTDNNALINEIGDYPTIWDKEHFTIFRDNPFDFRKIETKILGRTQRAAEILFRHYANQMLNAKNCQQLAEVLKKVDTLNKRVLYLAENEGNKNVQLIERTLRRELVPERIERILEI